jgi:hypothetical protein
MVRIEFITRPETGAGSWRLELIRKRSAIHNYAIILSIFLHLEFLISDV